MKIIFIMILLMSLVSCSSNTKYDNEIVLVSYYYIYSVNINTSNIERTKTLYQVDDYIDVFNIHTKYQNYIDINYTTYGNVETTLITSAVIDNNVYYQVDKYYNLIENKEGFLYLLTESNKILGYDDTYILEENELFPDI